MTAKDKNSLNYQKSQVDYKQITIRIKKDDCLLKLLEMYRVFNSDESINTIVQNALFEYLNYQLSKLEKREKYTTKNSTNPKNKVHKKSRIK